MREQGMDISSLPDHPGFADRDGAFGQHPHWTFIPTQMWITLSFPRSQSLVRYPGRARAAVAKLSGATAAHCSTRVPERPCPASPISFQVELNTKHSQVN